MMRMNWELFIITLVSLELVCIIGEHVDRQVSGVKTPFLEYQLLPTLGVLFITVLDYLV